MAPLWLSQALEVTRALLSGFPSLPYPPSCMACDRQPKAESAGPLREPGMARGAWGCLRFMEPGKAAGVLRGDG